MSTPQSKLWSLSVGAAVAAFHLVTAASMAQPELPQERPASSRATAWPIVIPSLEAAYAKRCAACHGAGATARSLLLHVRFHTDKELAQRVAAAHRPRLGLTPDDHAEVAAQLRKTTGTDPSMATGGYVGSRDRPASATAEVQGVAKPVFAPVEATIPLAEGAALTG